MSTTNESENEEFDSEAGETDNGYARAPVGAPNGRDRVSVSKKIEKPGDIKEALLESGVNANEIVSTVIEGLGAKRTFMTKSGEPYTEPDHATRLKYLEFFTHTVEGLPIKRQETIHRKVTTDEDLITQAKKSPAFARSIKGMLEKITEIADAHHSNKGGAHSAPSIGHH